MVVWPKALRVVERGLLILGLLLLGLFSFAYIHRFVMFRAEMTKFEATQFESAQERSQVEGVVSGGGHLGSLFQVPNIDHSLWSARRTKLYQTSLGKSAEALALLRIPRLHLEAPVLEGTDEFTLNRGVGRIAGTSHPGEAGNIGIAGHRDGFFRSLKDISTGDLIELVTPSRTDVYAVEHVRITDPADVGVLRLKAKPSLTLVTCYPFYFVGPAPRRYIVEASLKQ
jgi:sortase A